MGTVRLSIWFFFGIAYFACSIYEGAVIIIESRVHFSGWLLTNLLVTMPLAAITLWFLFCVVPYQRMYQYVRAQLLIFLSNEVVVIKAKPALIMDDTDCIVADDSVILLGVNPHESLCFVLTCIKGWRARDAETVAFRYVLFRPDQSQCMAWHGTYRLPNGWRKKITVITKQFPVTPAEFFEGQWMFSVEEGGRKYQFPFRITPSLTRGVEHFLTPTGEIKPEAAQAFANTP